MLNLKKSYLQTNHGDPQIVLWFCLRKVPFFVGLGKVVWKHIGLLKEKVHVLESNATVKYATTMDSAYNVKFLGLKITSNRSYSGENGSWNEMKIATMVYTFNTSSI